MRELNIAECQQTAGALSCGDCACIMALGFFVTGVVAATFYAASYSN